MTVTCRIGRVEIAIFSVLLHAATDVATLNATDMLSATPAAVAGQDTVTQPGAARGKPKDIQTGDLEIERLFHRLTREQEADSRDKARLEVMEKGLATSRRMLLVSILTAAILLVTLVPAAMSPICQDTFFRRKPHLVTSSTHAAALVGSPRFFARRSAGVCQPRA